ncbi:sensor histidine kinase [Roseovarius autotrophicus]|uniref:sensor histidine kinase n=1 Tax=Roseovarius autotrophicus TaxID=2824121 RepID=UPI001A0CCB17|nr:sensor histidine kinase [Roseovarius autotrophicus]MBE0453219.1 sensor histidine kinase [Roseovarius sp.]
MARPEAHSLRRRLLLQLLLGAAVMALGLYLAVRATAERATEAAQDAILIAAAENISDGLRGTEVGVEIDLNRATFSMVAAAGQDRLFWRVEVGRETLTGYDDLPLPGMVPDGTGPVVYEASYRGADLRLAAVGRSVMDRDSLQPALIVLGQTRFGQRAIADRLANGAALAGLAFFALAVPLSLIFTSSVLAPVRRLAEAVSRRGPADLRSMDHPTPRELAPFQEALNSFIARLRMTLSQTETFIAEAAHHIRTPLSTVRAEAEIALRRAEGEESRARLRSVIRAVDESARSAGQLLDHAMVAYRSNRMTQARIDLSAMLGDLARSFGPTADLRDISLTMIVPGPDAAEVIGDRVLVESALRNLIDNALKYTDAEGTVHVSLRHDGGLVVIEVCDTGRGLAGAETSMLTARFQRGPNAGTVVGSGLGLTIVAEVARAMGGAFDLSPAEGGGTCARLSLPAG